MNSLKKELNLFGDYEDAVTDKSNTVFHSALSPLINLGLITPEEIITKLKKVENKVPMNSLRGLHTTNYWLERIYERNLSKL